MIFAPPSERSKSGRSRVLQFEFAILNPFTRRTGLALHPSVLEALGNLKNQIKNFHWASRPPCLEREFVLSPAHYWVHKAECTMASFKSVRTCIRWQSGNKIRQELTPCIIRR